MSIEIPINGGIDTKSDPVRVRPPNFLDLQNCVFTASGGLRKRKGYDKLGDSVSLDSVAARGNELVGLNNTGVYTYASGKQSWESVDTYAAVRLTTETYSARSGSQTNPQAVVYQGIELVAWEEGSNIRYRLSDYATGAILYTAAAFSGSRPRVVGNGVFLQLFYADSSNLKVITIPYLTPSSPNAAVTVASTLNSTTKLYDVAAVPDEEATFVAFHTSTASPNATVRMLYVGGSGSVISGIVPGVSFVVPAANDLEQAGADPVFSTPPTASGGLAVSVGATTVMVAGCDDTDSNGPWFQHAALQTLVPEFPWIGESNTFVAATGATNVVCTYTGVDSNGYDTYWCAAEYGGNIKHDERQHDGQAIGSQQTIYDANIIAQPVFANTRPYLLVNFESTLQTTYLLYDLEDNACVGRLSPGVAGRRSTEFDTGAVTFRERATGIFEGILVERKRLDLNIDEDGRTAGTGFGAGALARVTMDFTEDSAYSTALKESALYINGGQLWSYDGVSCVEAGFHFYPEGVSTNADNTATGASREYTYRVYYEWTNRLGQRVRSTAIEFASGALTGTIANSAGHSHDIDIPYLNHTEKDDVTIVVYRTVGDANVALGAPFYRVSSPDPSTAGSDGGWIINDKTGTTVTFVDEVADADLVKNEIDYRTSGELDHVAPPGCRVVAEGLGRIWLGGTTDDNTLHYSKKPLPGEPPEFSDALYLKIPDSGGAITGMHPLNASLIVFCERKIFAIQGEGPNNFGQGSYTVQEVNSDLGVKSGAAGSVCQIPQGLLFQSGKGVNLLAQNYLTYYVGADVEAYNSGVVKRATVLPDTNHVYFLFDTGRSLLYDYQHRSWSTFTNHLGKGACVWQDNYCYVRANGDVWRQGSTYNDNGATYNLRLTTAWITLQHVQNYMLVRRLWLLGTRKSAHTLRVDVRYNYDGGLDRCEVTDSDMSGFMSTVGYGEGNYGEGSYGGSGSSRYQMIVALNATKCQSVQFEFTDVITSETPGESFEISSIVLDANVKEGPAKLEVARKFSVSSGKYTAQKGS